MEIVEQFPVIASAVIFALGLAVALIGNYLSFATQLAFIRGQLSELLKFNEGLSDLIEKSAKIDIAVETVEAMHSRVKFLEQKLLNGGAYGRSS